MVNREIYACVKWVDPVDQPSGFEELPKVFLAAKMLWEKSGDDEVSRVNQLLKKYVGAQFVYPCLERDGEIHLQSNIPCETPVSAYDVNLVGLDFSFGPLPRAKIEAYFLVPVDLETSTTGGSKKEFYDYPLSDAVSVFWKIPRSIGIKDLDFSMGNHQGIECIQIVKVLGVLTPNVQ